MYHKHNYNIWLTRRNLIFNFNPYGLTKPVSPRLSFYSTKNHGMVIRKIGKNKSMKQCSESADGLCKLCDGSIDCAPTAILLISLIHALYGSLGAEPDYFKNMSPKDSDHHKTNKDPKSFEDDSADTLPVFRPRASHKEREKLTDGVKYNRLRYRSAKITNAEHLSYDFIVVGGGTAGCVVASRLSENRRWKVLLVEAGPEEPKMALIPALANEFKGSSVDWKYAMRPNSRICQNRLELGCEVVQGRLLGGTSSINDMAYARGSPADYDEWAVLGNEGWSYNQVLTYFKYSEGNYDPDISNNKYFHSLQGPLDVGRYPYADENVDVLLSALTEMGFNNTDVNGRNQLGAMRLQSTSYYGERVSTYTAFIEPIRKLRRNIDILTGALVTKILIEVKDGYMKAIGVEILSNGSLTKVMSSKEVIISAGAINSPKILMQSGLGPREYLEYLDITVYRDLPIGSNFQDHLSICLPVVKLTKTETSVIFEKKMRDITTYYEKGYGPLAANFQVLAYLETQYSDIIGAPDLEIRFKGHNSHMYYNRMEMCISLLTPESRGEIVLNATDPMFGKPLIYPNFLKYHKDEKKLLEGLQEMMKIFDTETFKNAEIEFDPFPLLNNECKQEEHVSDKFWLCVLKHFTAPLHNYVGTCKMGPLNDPDSVVNADLKVYGVNYLRVVDASIIPKIIRGGTAATVVMIAERASDLIKSVWY